MHLYYRAARKSVGIRTSPIARLLLLLFVVPRLAFAVDEQAIAPVYTRAVAGDKQATEKCIALLEQAVREQPQNQLARAYLGSAYALRSRDMSFSVAKLQTFRRGMALMDSAVTAAPDNPRVRLVRALTCDPLPAFLGRKQIARDDFAKLAKMASQSSEKFSAGELKLIRARSLDTDIAPR